MKANIIQISLLILVILTSCEKEIYVESDFDTYVGRITYNEKNEYLRHEKRYYKNNLIVKIDCSPTYIWNYQYDKNNNIVKFDQGGCYDLFQYDSRNRCTIVKRYISDTLSVVTHKSYSDTLLTKEIDFNKYGDSISTTNYYYNNQNQLDSVIGKLEKIYHYYTSDSHKVVMLHNNIKYFESNTYFVNKLISIYEETYFSVTGIKTQSLKDTKKYDEKGNLIQSVLEYFSYYTGNSYYDTRYLYTTDNKLYKLESYDIDSKLEKYIEYTYDGDRLVKEQLYDSLGNKTEHTIVEYSNKK
ncbi:MAG TPA: hypothetical protein VK152_04720 [Paludibacter sp.]|nr:hypothetical protein [Paludibacter sp.]